MPGNAAVLPVSREAGVMPPGWVPTENPPDICKWLCSFKNNLFSSNSPHIHHLGLPHHHGEISLLLMFSAVLDLLCWIQAKVMSSLPIPRSF